MIRNYKGNFWSESYEEFKGVAFATLFDSHIEAVGVVNKILSMEKLQIEFGNTPMFIDEAYVRDNKTD